MTATRRLAAILAADVAGYSRLMGLDEDLDRAAAELSEARRLRGGEGFFRSILSLKAGGLWKSVSPKTRALVETTFFVGLRKAGMPEE